MKIKNNIIAHRGVFDNKLVPENTIPAFKKALELNYPIELDVQLTKDNTLVVFHDEDLKRMANRNEKIKDLDYAELKKIKILDTKETIPKFEDVLKLIKDKILIDIEIKDTKKIKETCEILMEELKEYKNYVIKSFNPKIVRYINTNYPDVEVGYLIHNKYPNKFLDWLLKSTLIISYCQPDFLAISKKLLKTKKFQKLSKKYPILVWTIKDNKEIKNDKLIYICNNLPFKKL